MSDKILVTSALPYINGVKHLGNLAGSILPADVYARFQRQLGREVLFVCGTDEHGTPAEIAAGAAREPVADYCARQHSIQADIYRRFAISFDHFGRTSGAANADLTQDIFRRLDAAGLIVARPVRQVWSAADCRFLPDRYVIGTCPSCGHQGARGDQCEACGKLLDPADLIDPRSALSGSADLELREVPHLFLRQSALAAQLRAWIEDDGDWEPLTRSIALKWLNEGLADRCITRDLDWGIPVPKPGFEHLKFYVWFDAPIGYLAFVREWSVAHGGDLHDWVAPGPGRRWVQFLGKDNVPFHTLSFPATLLGSGIEIRLADHIKGFNWLTYGGGKFSTSEGRGVFTDAAIEEFPADPWRWWLTANAPEGDDASFTFPHFATGVNADLADNLGNLVSRVTKFAAAQFHGRVPTHGTPSETEAALAGEATAILEACAADFEAIRLRKACGRLRALWSLGNDYVATQQPWTTIRTDPTRAACVTRTALNLLAVATAAAAPVVPDAAQQILTALGRDGASRWPDAGRSLAEPGGAPLAVPDNLFPKIPPARVAELEAKFGRATRGPAGSRRITPGVAAKLLPPTAKDGFRPIVLKKSVEPAS